MPSKRSAGHRPASWGLSIPLALACVVIPIGLAACGKKETPVDIAGSVSRPVSEPKPEVEVIELCHRGYAFIVPRYGNHPPVQVLNAQGGGVSCTTP